MPKCQRSGDCPWKLAPVCWVGRKDTAFSNIAAGVGHHQCRPASRYQDALQFPGTCSPIRVSHSSSVQQLYNVLLQTKVFQRQTFMEVGGRHRSSQTTTERFPWRKRSMHGQSGDWAQGLPHAERVWYHCTNCPLEKRAKRKLISPLGRERDIDGGVPKLKGLFFGYLCNRAGSSKMCVLSRRNSFFSVVKETPRYRMFKDVQEWCTPRDDEGIEADTAQLSFVRLAFHIVWADGCIVGCCFHFRWFAWWTFIKPVKAHSFIMQNWQHHQWLTSALLTDENAGGITVEVILCKYSRQIGGVVKLKPLGGLLQTGSRAISSSYTRYATFLCYCHEPWCYPGATPWQCTSVVGVVVEAVEVGVAVVAVVVGTGSSCSCSCW